jgi:hypothetical protein
VDMPSLNFSGRRTRWINLLVVWMFTLVAIVLALGLITERSAAESPMWVSLSISGVAILLASVSLCFASYFTLVMFRAKFLADENGIRFRNIRSELTSLQYSEIERATSISGGVDSWTPQRVLLVVTKAGARHRINAIPYLFNRGSINIQQWVDFINFKCGGHELSGWKIDDDHRSLAPFSDLETFKEAVKNEFLT